ncbi:MAG: glycosyltransferase [Treponema sp.]|jgi:glycosyltransferase involved in cell wall biosynthesis|nr:glycosyltransferase [Treponema sp.]
MNIVFLLRFWPIYGGGETVTRILANKLVESGYAVSIIYLWDKRQEDMPFIDKRITEYRIPDVLIDKHVGIHKNDYSVIINHLRSFLAVKNMDVIINQWLPPKVVYKANAGLVKKAKIICCCHTAVIPPRYVLTLKHKLFYFIFGKYGMKFRYYVIKNRLKDRVRYSDRWVFLTQYSLEEAKSLFKTNADIMRVIPNPLTYNYFASETEIERKDKEVLYVGRVDAGKRLQYLIYAWSMIEQNARVSDWHLTIVGNGPDLESVKAYARQLRCERVFFKGAQIPVEYYKRAALFALTSGSEGFPMVLTEAQQFGCVPVVMDSFSSLHEIVINNNNGIIIKNNDIQGFAEALERLMLDENYRLHLALGGLESCKRFSIDNVLRQWEALFYEVAENNRI